MEEEKEEEEEEEEKERKKKKASLMFQIPEKAPKQVMYCGPSNKSVDVVAGNTLKCTAA